MSNSVASPANGAVTQPIVSAQAATVLLLVVPPSWLWSPTTSSASTRARPPSPARRMLVHEFFHDGRHFLGFPCH